jgi:hypothetical protein
VPASAPAAPLASLPTDESPFAAVPFRRGAHRERRAPDLLSLSGREAVAAVRSGGFIAAVDPVACELPAGTVVEQDPPAGAPLERDAVVTLHVAIRRAAPHRASPEADAGLPPEASSSTRPDDTDEWFAALALPAVGEHTERRRLRRRKHRASASVVDFASDPVPPPEPAMRRAQPLGASGTVRRTITASSASAMYAVPGAIAGFRWRRGSAVVVAAGVLVLLGGRLVAPGERRSRSLDLRPPVAVARVKTEPRVSLIPLAPWPARRVVRTRAVLTRPLRGPTPTPGAPKPTAEPALARAAPALPRIQSQAAEGQPAHRSGPAAGQFAYLGQ